MPSIQIGQTEIPYDLRRSSSASERRITVTPGQVEVLALVGDDEKAVDRFLNRKRQWLFNTVREMEGIVANRHTVPQFMTGSKIPFRGRRISLTVRRTDAERISITYRNRFIVDLPHWAERNADSLIASELKLWLKQRARRDLNEIAANYRKRFGLVPRSVRVADFASGWGSCGPRGNILINWQLIFAPKKVLEYVLVHELAHLQMRSHGPEFWAELSKYIPDYKTSKSWLDANQSLVDDGWLER